MAERITICDRVFLGWTLGSTACLTAFSANYARGGDTERRRSALRTLRSVSHSPRRREVPDQEIWSNDLQLTVIVALDTLAASRHDALRPNGTAVGAMDCSVIDLLARAPYSVPSEADRAAVAGRMRRVTFRPNQILFSRGDDGREIYLVLHGRIRLSVLTSDGRELSFAHAGPGNVFGEIAALDGGERSAGATAITHAQVMHLSHNAILELVEHNPKMALAAIDFLCSRLRETDLRLEAIALYRIEVRLARLFLSALQLESLGTKDSNIQLNLGISQSELALLIGASRTEGQPRLDCSTERGRNYSERH